MANEKQNGGYSDDEWDWADEPRHLAASRAALALTLLAALLAALLLAGCAAQQKGAYPTFIN